MPQDARNRVVRAATALLLVLLLAGCTTAPPADPPGDPGDPATPPPETPVPVTAPSPVAPSEGTPSPTPSPPTPRPPPPPPARIVVANGTLEEVAINASTTYEIVFLLNATDQARVNLVFGAITKPAPYGWSAQVSLRSPEGVRVADSGTGLPEGGIGFTLWLRDLDRAANASEGPGEFLARVHTSHPTSLTAKAYVDDAAGPR